VLISLLLRIEEAILVFLFLKFLNKKKPSGSISRKRSKRHLDCSWANIKRWILNDQTGETEDFTENLSLDDNFVTITT
jgi:hypothetical protein